MGPGRRPTMRDVAAEAEVSFKTVSRVVNREGGVRQELVDRVDRAIALLGYRPDHRARGLRMADQQAVTIGFVLVDVSNPFFSKVFRGIEEVARRRDCLVLAGSTEGSTEREQQLIETLIGRRVDGLIVVSSGANPATLESEMRRGTPVVFLDIEPDLRSVDLVRSDHLAGTRLLTEHLLERGHVDIGYYGDDPRVFSARLRFEGFLAAMADRGLPVPDHRVVTGGHTEEQWFDIATERLRSGSRPTAIVSAQNFVTVGVTRALHHLGLRSTLAQVGFDDVELGDVVNPGLTVVSQRPRDLGRRAAELLFRRLDGSAEPPQRQVIPVPLIERGSGEIPPPAG